MDVVKIHLWASKSIKLKELMPFSTEWVALEDTAFSIWISLSEQERIHAAALKKDLINEDSI